MHSDTPKYENFSTILNKTLFNFKYADNLVESILI